MLPASGEAPPSTAVAEGLNVLLNKSGYLDALRMSKDPQDEARVENLDELVAVTREFARNNPDGTVLDFLTEVALVSDADDLDDASGSVSLMTMHTAKGSSTTPCSSRASKKTSSRTGSPRASRAVRRRNGACSTSRSRAPQALAPLARDDPRPVRRGVGRDAEPVPAGDPARAHRLAPVARRHQRARRGSRAR
jgi:hypothetical protein